MRKKIIFLFVFLNTLALLSMGGAKAYVSDNLIASNNGQSKELTQKVALMYEEANQYFMANQQEEALRLFKKIEKLLPDYKSTRNYITFLTAKKTENVRLAEARAIVSPPKERVSVAQAENLAESVRREKQQSLSALPSADVEVTSPEPAPVTTMFPSNSSADAGHPNSDSAMNATYVQASSRKNELVQESAELQKDFYRGIANLYERGEKYFNEGRLGQARLIFDQINELAPGFKQTNSYLEKLANASWDDDLDLPAAVSWTDTVGAQPSGKKVSRFDLESLYAYAVHLYQSERLVDAKQKFIEVAEIDKDYKLTQRYLGLLGARSPDSVPEVTEMPETPADLSGDPRAQKRALKARQREEKLAQQQKMRDEKKARKEALKALNQEEMKKELDDLYVEAIQLFGERKFDESEKRFNQVLLIKPGYKNCHHYLKMIVGERALTRPSQD